MQQPENTIDNYMKRYGKTILSSYDEKIIHSMKKLRLNYQNIQENRKKTILITRDNITIQTIMNEKEIPNKKEKKEKKEKDISYSTCKAIKMDGTPCNVKVNNMSCLCKRHSRK